MTTPLRRLFNYGVRGPTSADFAKNRNIDNKSFLKFHFPNGLVAKLPFFENVTIREDKKAKLVTYNPVGRSSSLYAYTGAESRNLRVDFSLTLPHLQSVYAGDMMRFTSRTLTTREDRKELILNPKSDQLKKDVREKVGTTEWEMFNQQYHSLPQQSRAEGQNPFLSQDIDKLAANLDLRDLTPEDREFLFQTALHENLPANNKLQKLTHLVVWWVNLIRSSVLNNQEDMTQGPPVIRLNHGVLYDDIPCVCKGYSVAFDDTAGMDLETLLSRRIRISLDLDEFRAGDFGKYTPTEYIKRDNVAGWEAIIKHSTTDPMRGIG